MDDSQQQHWDRGRWITVFSSHTPTIRELTECLGLIRAPSAATTNRGIPKFDAPESKRLSSEVQRLSKNLPKDRDALLDFAADPHSLRQELDELLAELGPAIWGEHADRRLLRTPSESSPTWPRRLCYENEHDRSLLKTYLYRWVIIKACYYIRNMRLKRPSAADEYETVADIDVDSPASADKARVMSQSETPRTGTPAPSDLLNASDGGGEPQTNPRKRKSLYRSFSDGEEDAAGEASSAAKKRSYQSATMPVQRKSPRKSLTAARLSTENIPPSPSPTHLQQPASAATAPPLAATDASRTLLSPLSGSALNGTTRPPNPPANGFTAVNNAPATGFTAVNTVPTKNSPSGSPSHYTSPYPAPAAATQESAAPAPTTAQPTPIAPVPSQAQAQAIPNGHDELRPLAAAPAQHNHRRQSTPSMRLAHSQTPPVVTNGSNPTPPPGVVGTANPSTSFHNHSVPGMSAAHRASPAPRVQPPPARYEGSAAPPVLPSNAPVLQHGNGPDGPYQNGQVATSRLPNTAEVTLLQCELLGHLMRYFFPRDGPKQDEGALFRQLYAVWGLNEPTFQRIMGNLFERQREVLFTWIDERRKISQLQFATASRPGVQLADMADRLLAMNDLRVLRLKWKSLKTLEGGLSLSPEDLLCKTFATMTKTEGTEHLFKEGLASVNDDVFAFLKSNDMKITLNVKAQAPE